MYAFVFYLYKMKQLYIFNMSSFIVNMLKAYVGWFSRYLTFERSETLRDWKQVSPMIALAYCLFKS